MKNTTLAANPERLDLAMEAVYQIESLAFATLRLLDENPDYVGPALKGIAARTRELSGIVISALDDGADPVEEISHRLKGI